MGIPNFLVQLRKKIGHDLLMMPSVSATVFDEEKRLLLVRPADRNLWVLPGGIIEPGETPADAAVREVWEEAGLYVELTGIFGVFGGGSDRIVTYPNGDRAAYITTIFRSKRIAGNARPDRDEIAEVRFFTSEEILSTADTAANAPPVTEWMKSWVPMLFDPAVQNQFQASSWHPDN